MTVAPGSQYEFIAVITVTIATPHIAYCYYLSSLIRYTHYCCHTIYDTFIITTLIYTCTHIRVLLFSIST